MNQNKQLFYITSKFKKQEKRKILKFRLKLKLQIWKEELSLKIHDLNLIPTRPKPSQKTHTNLLKFK